MKIYTRTGDKGETSLVGGIRVAKSSVRVETYGTVDELNSVIGLAITEVSSIKYKVSSVENELQIIQKDLFEIGAFLATPQDTKIAKGKSLQKNLPLYLIKRTKAMEKLIDSLTIHLTPMTTFILPGGGKSGSLLHVARSVARRAERRIVALSQQEKVDANVLMYFNRLSDLLFTMARFVNLKEKQEETKWQSKTSRG